LAVTITAPITGGGVLHDGQYSTDVLIVSIVFCVRLGIQVKLSGVRVAPISAAGAANHLLTGATYSPGTLQG